MVRTGRPRKAIDWETVYSLCKLHCTHEEIASVIRISLSTLTHRCKKELKKTLMQVWQEHAHTTNVSLRRKQLEVALTGKGNVHMLKHLGEHILGQTPKHLIGQTDGGKDSRLVIDFGPDSPPQTSQQEVIDVLSNAVPEGINEVHQAMSQEGLPRTRN